ncbi:MAG: hypothetical protein ACYDEQ_11920, partial [Desulfocucumaceae bacterium]
ESDHSSISVSKPEIMEGTLKHLTAGQVKEHLELLRKELDSWNIQIRPGDLSLLNKATDLINMKVLTDEELLLIAGALSRLYGRYHEIYSKYLRDLDRPKDLQSFPFVKIVILIAVISSKLNMQSNNFKKAGELIIKVYCDLIEAMKAYCLINSKTDKDRAHFAKISKYTALDFFEELKEVIASPATKPKYKFPPMEAIYLWNCAEYLEGYRLELEDPV